MGNLIARKFCIPSVPQANGYVILDKTKSCNGSHVLRQKNLAPSGSWSSNPTQREETKIEVVMYPCHSRWIFRKYGLILG